MTETTTPRPVVYTATVTSVEGRQGSVKSNDGRLDLALSYPKAMGGDDGPGTNPEQLFAAGYGACFHSALKGSARLAQVDITGSTVVAEVSLTGTITDGVFLEVTLNVNLPGHELEVAQQLLEAAHARCPYSKAIAGNIIPTFHLSVDS